MITLTCTHGNGAACVVTDDAGAGERLPHPEARSLYLWLAYGRPAIEGELEVVLEGQGSMV
jgi:hypothetical protein